MTGARSELRDVRGEYGIDGGSAAVAYLLTGWPLTCSYRFRTDPSSIGYLVLRFFELFGDWR